MNEGVRDSSASPYLVDLTIGDGLVGVVLFAPSPIVGDAFARVLSIAGHSVRVVDASARRLPERWWDGGAVVIAFEALVDALPEELRLVGPLGPRLIVLGDRAVHLPARVVGSDATCQDLIEVLATMLPGHTDPNDNRQLLTRRHTEILQLVADGHSTEEVGLRLGIAPKTVNNHLSSVYKRLGARNLTRAVLVAARRGLVDVTAASADSSHG